MGNAPRSYHASSDAVLDPFRRLDQSATLIVVDGEAPAEPLGRAHLAGWALAGGRAIATYRLIVGGAEVPGLFALAGRRFEPLIIPEGPPGPR
jgi:hypothetical protein